MNNPLLNPRCHKTPPRIPILGQMNPVHILISYFIKMHFNIIFQSTLTSIKLSLQFCFNYFFLYVSHSQPKRPN